MVPRSFVAFLAFALPVLVVLFAVVSSGFLIFSNVSFSSVRMVLSWVCGGLVVLLISDAILLLGSLGLNAVAEPGEDEREANRH